MTNIQCPLLASVGDLEIIQNSALSTVIFPLLTDVDGTLTLSSNGALTSITFPQMRFTQNVHLARNAGTCSAQMQDGAQPCS